MMSNGKAQSRCREFSGVPDNRRKIMAAVRHKDTGPELFVRSLIHSLGYRFTVKGPKNKSLPGSPDIVLPARNTVIFVHGCFWHGHSLCKKYHPPKTRTDFWNNKIIKNRKRDKKTLKLLKALGWKTMVVWECELKNVKKLKQKLVLILKP
jgi:DNA mismatch endonuclease, patch repair protein